jgi:hypothetical protein
MHAAYSQAVSQLPCQHSRAAIHLCVCYPTAQLNKQPTRNCAAWSQAAHSRQGAVLSYLHPLPCDSLAHAAAIFFVQIQSPDAYLLHVLQVARLLRQSLRCPPH